MPTGNTRLLKLQNLLNFFEIPTFFNYFLHFKAQLFNNHFLNTHTHTHTNTQTRTRTRTLSLSHFFLFLCFSLSLLLQAHLAQANSVYFCINQARITASIICTVIKLQIIFLKHLWVVSILGRMQFTKEPVSSINLELQHNWKSQARGLLRYRTALLCHKYRWIIRVAITIKKHLVITY